MPRDDMSFRPEVPDLQAVKLVLTIPPTKSAGFVGVAVDWDGFSVMFSTLTVHCESRTVGFESLNNAASEVLQIWREQFFNNVVVVFDRAVVGLPAEKVLIAELVEAELCEAAKRGD